MKRSPQTLDLFACLVASDDPPLPCCDCGGPSTGLGMSTGGKRPTCDSCELDRLGMVIAILDAAPPCERDDDRLVTLAEEHERVKERLGGMAIQESQ